MSSNNQIVLVIRLIRSFEYRNIKNIVVKDIDPSSVNIAELKAKINAEIKSAASNLPPPFKTFTYDTLKIEHFPFKAKSNDPVINCENDDALILTDEAKSLDDYKIINETEISYFRMDDYLKYKQNKTIKLE